MFFGKRRLVWALDIHTYRVLVIPLLSLVAAATLARGSGREFAAGLSIIEEGDDRLRPGALLQVEQDQKYRGKLHYFGRQFGPVKESTLVLSMTRGIQPFKTPYLRTYFGAVVMNEQTPVTYRGQDSSENQSENNPNLGGVFGVSLTVQSASLKFNLDWDSHIFPAGLGGLFLSTGRKQAISATLGVIL